MAFELERQLVDMVPLEGGFVEACLRDQVIRDEVELGTFEDSERLRLDVLERGLGRDAGVREELQDLPGLVQVLVPLDRARHTPAPWRPPSPRRCTAGRDKSGR